VKCILGLGNPGKKYVKTRHNIGYLFLDYLALHYKIPFVPGKGDYYVSKTRCFEQEIILLKPTTFMNLSGEALTQINERYRLGLEQSLIVCDDFNLPFGTVRFRKKGSDGGHNGLKSVIYHAGSLDVPRMRLGIGSSFENAIDFVLTDFTSMEQKQLNDFFKIAKMGIEKWFEYGIDEAMNLYNGNVLT